MEMLECKIYNNYLLKAVQSVKPKWELISSNKY